MALRRGPGLQYAQTVAQLQVEVMCAVHSKLMIAAVDSQATSPAQSAQSTNALNVMRPVHRLPLRNVHEVKSLIGHKYYA